MSSLAGLLALLACGGAPDSPSTVTPSAAGEVPSTGDAAATLVDALTGTTSTSVTWSVQEVAAGGTVTAAGLYTAPATAGTYHVVAQSQLDATKTATATVTVTAPAGGALVDVKAYGAVGDGVTDDTAAFQAAADARKPLLISAPPVRYRITNGIRIYDSVQGDGSMPEIWLDNPSGDWGDSMLQIVNYQGTGLVISGLHLDGGWTGIASGEHSSGVHIAGSQNVTVEKMLLENFRGDGVYVGGGSFTTAQSKNVVVRDNDIGNPRRCTVAVIHVNGLSITNNTLRKANTFVANIDIEPNPNGIDNAWNVTVDRNTFTSPIENAVSLYHSSTWPYPPGGVGGNITISNNTGDTSAGVNITSSADWVNVTQTNNTWR